MMLFVFFTGGFLLEFAVERAGREEFVGKERKSSHE
jgi:hypothetical protein